MTKAIRKNLIASGYRVTDHRNGEASLWQVIKGRRATEKIRYPSSTSAWAAALRIEECVRTMGRDHAGRKGRRRAQLELAFR